LRNTGAGWTTVETACGPGCWISAKGLFAIDADNDALRRMAVFDAVVNNADRKGGHVLDDGRGGPVGVDHGLTFNVDEKLRTVLWGWAGEPIDADAVQALDRVPRTWRPG